MICPEIVGRLISARGIGSDGVASFLDPKLSNDLPDPGHLLDMSVAVNRLVVAVQQKQKISVLVIMMWMAQLPQHFSNDISEHWVKIFEYISQTA